MTQTIEAFVSRLQAEGVEAGRQAADAIQADAERRARELVADAERRAAQIVRAAETDAEQLRARTQTELQLAARDLVVRLQAALTAALQSLLRPVVRETLQDPDFLAPLIRDVVLQYASRDAAGPGRITVVVADEVRGRLTDWLVAAFSDPAGAAARIDVRGTLADAGFEYSLGDGTVDITADAVVDALADLIGPDVRKLIAEAAGP